MAVLCWTQERRRGILLWELLCGWGYYTWWCSSGWPDRSWGQSPWQAQGGKGVSRLWILQRGLKYRRSVTLLWDLLNPGSLSSASHDLRALCPCNGRDEVTVLILEIQYPCSSFACWQGPSQLSENCSAECLHAHKTLLSEYMSFQESQADLENGVDFLMTKTRCWWQFSWR